MLKIKDKYDYRRELCAALRSGQYPRSGSLYDIRGNRHCPFSIAGVLIGAVDGEFIHYAYVQDALGLSLQEAEHIMHQHDLGKWSFEQQAAWIEALP